MLTEQKIPKYRKSTDSNISKSNQKSKHKHQYEECLIQYDFNFNGIHKHTQLSSYCIICGKIGGILKNSIVTDLTQEHITKQGKIYYSRISDEELYKKYNDKLPVFFVENIFEDAYVDLKENNYTNQSSIIK